MVIAKIMSILEISFPTMSEKGQPSVTRTSSAHVHAIIILSFQ